MPQVAHRGVSGPALARAAGAAVARASSRALGLPVFVKPARLGSSVGIVEGRASRASSAGALEAAFAHDPLAIVEAASTGDRGRVLGARRRGAARVDARRDRRARRVLRLRGQVRAGRDGAGRAGADLASARAPRSRGSRSSAFALAGCSGLARVDFFVEGERVLLNELNTMPGFTATSVYAKLWEADGIPYPALVEGSARSRSTRHARERALPRSERARSR